jgi:ATP-dependent Clp protease ATP-binding subunit ClpA
VSLPASREARAALFSEVERLRPIHEPDRPPVDNQSVFERFNDEARRAMVAAQQVTRGVGHDEIGTAELLVVLATKTFASGKVLVRLGISAESVYEATDRVVTPGTVAHLTHRPMAKDLKKAILQTGKEVDRLNETTIGTEHLLLGVLQERKSVGGKVLRELGVNYDAARDAILDVRAADQPPPLPPPPP